MAHNNSQWISHTIEGGWATDFGHTFYASPDNGELRVPWCEQCENVTFYPDGSFGKYSGTVDIYPTPIKAPETSIGIVESSFVRSLYNYVRMGASLTGTQTRIAVIGSHLYDVSNPSYPTRVGELSTGGLIPPHLTTFNDLLIIGTGTSTPKSWDLTTFQSLAGSPPEFSFSTLHAGRHWASGNDSNPSRLYYSAVGNPEDWVGAGSGSIDVDPGDGDAIVGLLSWKKELWVFKGPNRLSIHRITGTSPSDFARTPFIYGVSAAGHQSIFQVGDDFAFWSPRGSCHSLSVTADYGDYKQSYLNYPILSWCQNYTNLQGGIYSNSWQVVTDPTRNISYSVLNNSPLLYSKGLPKTITFAMDWNFRSEENPYPRFIRLTFKPFTSVGLSTGYFDQSRNYATFGTVDGRIPQELSIQSTYFSQYVPNTTAAPISYRISTPALSYGPSYYKKTLTAVSIDLVSSFNRLGATTGTADMSYGGRGIPGATVSFSDTGYTALGIFQLGVHQLGTNETTPAFTEAVQGESTALTYTFVEDSPLTNIYYGADARVKHFSTLITPSGSSMESV